MIEKRNHQKDEKRNRIKRIEDKHAISSKGRLRKRSQPFRPISGQHIKHPMSRQRSERDNRPITS